MPALWSPNIPSHAYVRRVVQVYGCTAEVVALVPANMETAVCFAKTQCISRFPRYIQAQ